MVESHECQHAKGTQHIVERQKVHQITCKALYTLLLAVSFLCRDDRMCYSSYNWLLLFLSPTNLRATQGFSLIPHT